MEYQRITNTLASTPDKGPKFFNKKGIELYDQFGNEENGYKPSKQIRSKKINASIKFM